MVFAHAPEDAQSPDMSTFFIAKMSFVEVFTEASCMTQLRKSRYISSSYVLRFNPPPVMPSMARLEKPHRIVNDDRQVLRQTLRWSARATSTLSMPASLRINGSSVFAIRTSMNFVFANAREKEYGLDDDIKALSSVWLRFR